MTLATQIETAQGPTKQQIYSDPICRKILQSLLRDLRTIITPEILQNDEITYPQIESFVGTRVEDHEGLLARMGATGVLIGEVIDKAPRCPECGSQQLSTRYVCPKCFDIDIIRSYLYEHLKCGKVAGDESFRKGEILVCPKCQMVLHDFGVEYRAVGAWYKCNNCSESFNAPTHSHFCRQNRHQFTMDRARLVPIYQYRINLKILPEIKRGVLLYSDAVTMLENMGLEVFAPHSLPGKSGQPQPFDIVVRGGGGWRGQKTIAMDIASSETGVGVDTVRAFAAKLKDSKPSGGYLVATPQFTDEARTLAKNLKVATVEGVSLKEAMETLKQKGIFKGPRS